MPVIVMVLCGVLGLVEIVATAVSLFFSNIP